MALVFRWFSHAEAPQTLDCGFRTCPTMSLGLAQGPYVALERDSNPRPSGRKASTLPMRHHVF